MRLGIAHHFGWAVAVTASADHKVVDRRRIELVEPGMPTAPIHHAGKTLDDDALAVLVAQVRASAVRATSAALDGVATHVPEPIVSMSLRAWSQDFPVDIAIQRRAPYDARADSVMYRQVLAELALARGWDVHLYDAKDVEARAVGTLAERADEILRGPRAAIGPPWAKDHRMALAATIVAGEDGAHQPAGRAWAPPRGSCGARHPESSNSLRAGGGGGGGGSRCSTTGGAGRRDSVGGDARGDSLLRSTSPRAG